MRCVPVIRWPWLFHFTHFQGDLVDSTGESRLRADADALRDWRLVVDADVRGHVRGEDIRRCLPDAFFGDRFVIGQKNRLAALAAAAVVDEVGA